jgi:hypothetical protein
MWFYRNEEFGEDIEKYDSFVYLITRLKDDEKYPKYYIGKKSFWFSKKIKAGRNKRIKYESDWITYYGSSEWLKEAIRCDGEQYYRREILHLCTSKGESFVLEAKEQLYNNVLSKFQPSGMKLFFNKHILGSYKKEYFTIHEMNDLLSTQNQFFNNHGINNGSQASSLYCWVNNGVEEKKIPRIEINSLEYRYWSCGRLTSHNKGTIGIYFQDNVRYIAEEELDFYTKNGWKIGINTLNDERNKIYVCHDESKIQKLIERDNVDEFLKINEGWRIGQFTRSKFTTSGLIPAIDIYTGEKIMISTEEYDTSKYVSRNTKKIKVKRKNKIIFTGYSIQFFKEYEEKLPISIFKKYLREKNTSNIIVQKGKFIHITDEMWTITEI